MFLSLIAGGLVLVFAFLLAPMSIGSAQRMRPRADPRLLAITYLVLSLASALACGMYVAGVIS